MKKYTPFALAAILALPVHAQDDAAAAAEAPAEQPAEVTLSPEEIKTNSSYGFGYQYGSRFLGETSRFGLKKDDIDPEQFAKGFFDAYGGGDPAMDEAQLQAAMLGLSKLLEERQKAASAENLAAAEKFLEENKAKEGVTTLESGLQYTVLEKGGDKTLADQGDDVKANPQFLVNYKGTLIDGTEFDASPEGQPVPFGLNVVPGFKEALQLMPVGAKWRLFLHPDLAYRDQPVGDKIGPNSALIFDLEVTEIKAAPARPQFDPSQFQGGE